MSLADKKILAWMMKGSVEYNVVQRDIDIKLLQEALLPSFKPLFKILVQYFSRYKTPPTFEILSENLAEDFETVDLAEHIKEFDCSEAEIGFYIDQVRDRYNAFLAKKISDFVVTSGNDLDVKDFNRDLVAITSKIDRLRRSAVFSEGKLQDSAEERAAEYLYTKENPNEISGVFTGYLELDDYIFGLKKSEMMVISGASSSGKSLLMMNIAINAWLGPNNPLNPYGDFGDTGKNVIFFSLEMSKKQLERRVDANLARIRQKALERGFLTEEEEERFMLSLEFQKNYNKVFHTVDMPRGSRVVDVEARYDTIISEFEPDLVCVDYLGIMKPNRDFGQDWLEVGHVAADLHEFCRNKKIPVITAAQRKTRDKKAKVQYNDEEEIGRSKLIGDNSNIVLMIERRDEEHLREDMVIHIAKNRDGAKGKFFLEKEFEKMRINSFPDGWAEDLGDENDF